jgi:multicomponent Na+:H+ antiporter subunit C
VITFLQEEIVPRFNYWVYVVIMMIGLHALIAKRNLVKKLMGMAVFQTAIILFYVSIAVKSGATIPIYYAEDIPGHGAHEETSATPEDNHHPLEGHQAAINVARYANPLPHVLMLTAIVVGVATLGVGLAIVQKLYKQYETVEEDEILALIQKDPHQYDAVRPEGYGPYNL